MNKRLEDWVNWILYDELKNGVINAPKHKAADLQSVPFGHSGIRPNF